MNQDEIARYKFNIFQEIANQQGRNGHIDVATAVEQTERVYKQFYLGENGFPKAAKPKKARAR